jgi:hypothetical protein
MRHRWWKTSAQMIILILSLRPQAAGSLDLNVTHIIGIKAGLDFNASVGIDKPTQDFLNKLPEELRKQIVQAMKESLHLLDESIEQYINQLDAMLARQLVNAQCAASGAVGNALGQVKQSVTGKSPLPIEELRKHESGIIHSFHFQDLPLHYLDVYGDFLYNAKVTFCTLQIEPTVLPQLQEIYEEIFKRWSVWNRVSVAGCANVSGCYVRTRSDLDAKVAASDPRDLEAVNAKQRITAVVAPTEPGWLGKWDPTQAELSLGELLSIGTGIDTAKAIRELKAQTIMDDVLQKRNQTQSAGSEALVELQRIGTDAVLTVYTGIWDKLTPVLAMEQDVKNEISQAIGLYPERKQDYQREADQYAAAHGFAAQQSAVAHDRYDRKNAALNARAKPDRGPPDREPHGPGPR